MKTSKIGFNRINNLSEKDLSRINDKHIETHTHDYIVQCEVWINDDAGQYLFTEPKTSGYLCKNQNINI